MLMLCLGLYERLQWPSTCAWLSSYVARFILKANASNRATDGGVARVAQVKVRTFGSAKSVWKCCECVGEMAGFVTAKSGALC